MKDQLFLFALPVLTIIPKGLDHDAKAREAISLKMKPRPFYA